MQDEDESIKESEKVKTEKVSLSIFLFITISRCLVRLLL